MTIAGNTCEQAVIDNDLADGLAVEVEFCEDLTIGIALPATLQYEVAGTGPANSTRKPVVLANGLAIKVPECISVRDVITVDTGAGEFSGVLR